MKTRLLSFACVLLVGAAAMAPACAGGKTDPAMIAADTLVARPACLVATIVGSVVFIVSLPVAAISKSTDKAAQTLVVKPAEATFKRPLGDFDSLSN